MASVVADDLLEMEDFGFQFRPAHAPRGAHKRCFLEKAHRLSNGSPSYRDEMRVMTLTTGMFASGNSDIGIDMDGYGFLGSGKGIGTMHGCGGRRG